MQLADKLSYIFFLLSILSTYSSTSFRYIFFIPALLFWIIKQGKSYNRKLLFFLPWLFANFISFIFSTYFKNAAGGLSEAIINTSVIFIAYDLFNTPKRIRRFIYFYYASIVTGAIVSLTCYERNFPVGIGYRGAGSFIALSFLIPFMASKNLLPLTLPVMAIYIASFFLIEGSQRMAVIATALYILIFIRRLGIKTALILYSFIFIIMVYAASRSNFIREKFSALLKKEKIVDVVAERMYIWNRAIQMGIDNLLTGVGPRCFQLSFDYKYDENRKKYGIPDYVGSAHNTFVNVFAETGVIGVIGYILWLLNYIYLTAKSKPETFEGMVLKYHATGFIITFLFIGLTESVEWLAIPFLAGSVIGLLIRSGF